MPGIIKKTEERLREAEQENKRLNAENVRLNEIVKEQADALIELAELLEGGQE